MAKGKGQIQGWITKNGVHIPIYGEYTVRGGVEPKAKGAKFKSAKVTSKTVSKALKKKYDEDSKETWYEGKINGKDVRITQETAGSDKFWNVDIGKPGNRHKLLTDNNEPMSFKSLEDAHDEIAHELNSKSGQDSVASKGKRAVMTKSEFDTMNKEIDARDETEHLKKWEGQYDKAIAGGATVKKGKKYEDRDWNKDVDDAKRYGYSEQSETGKKPVTKVEEEKQARQSFRDKKAQEQGFADDASMRSYNEETGVNKETWKATPESYAQSKGKSIRDIAQEVNKNDAARAQANQLMKDGRTYDEAAALAHSDMERGTLKGQASSVPTEPYAKSNNKYLGQSVKDLNKLDVRNLNDSELSQLREHASASSRTGARGADKLWKNTDAEINRRAMEREGSTSKSFSPESSAQTINDMQRRRANGGGKDDDWKTAQSVLESAPAGTTMIQTGNRGVKFQYTKGEDGKWHSSAGEDYTQDSKTLSMSWRGESGPRVEFTTSDKALSNEDIKASHTAAVNGRLNQTLGLDRNNRPIGNRSTRKVDTSTPKSQDSFSASMNERSRIRRELHAKDEAMKAAMPTTVSGLRSAYADATGSMKSKIAAELRRKGYSLVGGKWVKGRKE